MTKQESALDDAHASRLMELEALRQITDNLKRLNNKMDAQSDKMNAMDVRLAKMESGRVETDIDEIRGMLLRVKDRLAILEIDKGRREGAIGAWEWLMSSWPALIGFIALVVGFIYAKETNFLD